MPSKLRETSKEQGTDDDRMSDEQEAALRMNDEPGSDAAGQPGKAAYGPGGAERGRPPLAGSRAVLAGSAAVLIIASLLGAALGFGAKAACRAGAWNIGVEQFQAHCYTDIYPLYFGEGLSAGKVPYLQHPVEYPVVMGAVMQAVAWVLRPVTDDGAAGGEFFDLTVTLLALFLLAGVLATAYCAGPDRRWTALLVALSPALILGAFINWDLIAMGLLMLGLAAWAARRPWLAGVLLGLAVATKFYPVFCLGPLFLLACAGISALALGAARRPRLPQLIFLTVAAFVLSNKVWSPQYVVWLVPLVVLARPRMLSYALWQLAEIGYFYAIWDYLVTVVAG